MTRMSAVSRAKRRFVGMGQALVGHAGSVGTPDRHEPCEPTVSPRIGARA